MAAKRRKRTAATKTKASPKKMAAASKKQSDEKIDDVAVEPEAVEAKADDEGEHINGANGEAVMEVVTAETADQQVLATDGEYIVLEVSAEDSVTENGFRCHVCDKPFTRKYHLDRHLQLTPCSGQPPPAHPCEVRFRLHRSPMTCR